MVSKVDICNDALLRIGKDPIASLSENTSSAKALNLIYDRAADYVMQDKAWSSCTFRSKLARLNYTPVYGYTYAFQLPTDPYCLRVWTGENLDPNSYTIEGRKLLCNSSEVYLTYSGRVTSAEDYGLFLSEAIVLRLIYQVANKLTSGVDLQKFTLSYYQQEVNKLFLKDRSQILTSMPNLKLYAMER